MRKGLMWTVATARVPHRLSAASRWAGTAAAAPRLRVLPRSPRSAATSGVEHSRSAAVVYVPVSAGDGRADGGDRSEDRVADIDIALSRHGVGEVGGVRRADLARMLSKAGATTMLHPTDHSRVLAVGLGCTSADVGPAAVRDATAAAVAALRTADVTVADFHAPERSDDPTALAAELGRAVVLADYRFDRFLSGDKAPSRLEEATIVLPPSATDDLGAAEGTVERLLATADGTTLARDLANRRGDDCTPAEMESVARSLSHAYGLTFASLDADELAAEGLHLLLAVGQAAREQPRLVTLEADGLGGKGTLLVVGKGVTFDTGGLNLKPTGAIEGMHMDMGGAAAVLGAARAVGALRAADQMGASPYSKVVFCLALAENAIGPSALKPHEILRSHKGLSVSVGNTDAEGRLCLADVLSWAQQRHGPELAGVVDLATLTGACVVALGEYAAGLFSNPEGAELAAALVASGSRNGEVLHPLPILPGHHKEIAEHDHADVCSTGASRYGGACTAAAFLERFVDEGTPWAHIDIAGPAMTCAERGVVPKGGTGFGAATIVDLIAGNR
eukprot:CAMPEP_0182924052 /NCGR_PEP_ID=MMETSP0105_2-20130417/5816_1 /TAXON_ID=81532 ORGANISM="Acanthoeca-like sp., Strain 10tr" /NCGR_SAMPLE_ID=MMETSP0105_2 /ASSEMBLY_ACC=CAM_ASM_000205 /LENGTH=562 /DNA_ID=CAMNT_0025061807 /DNA_START=132 /DNA_END=1820 /DNA_ORIENTATION=-